MIGDGCIFLTKTGYQAWDFWFRKRDRITGFKGESDRFVQDIQHGGYVEPPDLEAVYLHTSSWEGNSREEDQLHAQFVCFPEASPQSEITCVYGRLPAERLCLLP